MMSSLGKSVRIKFSGKNFSDLNVEREPRLKRLKMSDVPVENCHCLPCPWPWPWPGFRRKIPIGS